MNKKTMASEEGGEAGFTSTPRQFEAVVVPPVIHERLSYTGDPRTMKEHFELSLPEVRYMVDKLNGKPMRFEHFKHIDIGRVTSSWFDEANNRWMCNFELDTHKQKAAVVTASMIDLGKADEGSLTHYRTSREPVEFTICHRGARQGSRVTNGKIQIPPELISGLHNTLDKQINNIRAVQASAVAGDGDHYIGSDLVIATLPEDGKLETKQEFYQNKVMASTESSPPPASSTGYIATSGINGIGLIAPNGTEPDLMGDLTKKVSSILAGEMLQLAPTQSDRKAIAESTGLPPPQPSLSSSSSPHSRQPPSPPQQLTSPPSPPQQQQDTGNGSSGSGNDGPAPMDDSKLDVLVEFARESIKSGDEKTSQAATAVMEVTTNLLSLQENYNGLAKQLEEMKRAKAESDKKAAEAKRKLSEIEAATIHSQARTSIAQNVRNGRSDPRTLAEMDKYSQNGTLERVASYTANVHDNNNKSRSIQPDREAAFNQFEKLVNLKTQMRGAAPGPSRQLVATSASANGYEQQQPPPPRRPLFKATRKELWRRTPDESKEVDDEEVRASAPNGLVDGEIPRFCGPHPYWPEIWIGDMRLKQALDGSNREELRRQCRERLVSLGFDHGKYRWQISSTGGLVQASTMNGTDRFDERSHVNRLPELLLRAGGNERSAFNPGGSNVIRDFTSARASGSFDYSNVSTQYEKPLFTHLNSFVISGVCKVPPSFPAYWTNGRWNRVEASTLAELWKGCDAKGYVEVGGHVAPYIPNIENREPGGIVNWTGEDDHRSLFHIREAPPVAY